MIETLIAAMVASVIATATPEGRANAEPIPVPTAAPAPVASLPPVAKAANPNRRYCIIETITGSRIPNKLCRTREVWLLNGFDPLAK